jgi:hypothetical protein
MENINQNPINRRILPSDPSFIFDLIARGTNFSLLRFADGERLLIEGLGIPESSQAFRMDGWNSKGGNTKLGVDLARTLLYRNSNVIHAIACPCCSFPDFKYFAFKGDSRIPITHSNIFINGYYKKFQNFISQLQSPINLVANCKANLHALPFGAKQILQVPSDCVTEWERWSKDFMLAAEAMAIGAINEIFFIAAGPMSEPIIVAMAKANPDNIYLDIGSALDEYLFGKKTRPYMFDSHPLSRRFCDINEVISGKNRGHT